MDVEAKFNKEGQIRPMSFVWVNGHKYEIDKVLDVRRAASLKAGGQGIRYTCKVLNKHIYLFQDEKNKWFIEGN
mgnify:FL=1